MTTAALTTPRHRLRAVLAAAAVGTSLLGGCAMFSPVQTNYVYQAADGVNADFGDLALRGVLVIAEAKDGPGTVVGQIVNSSAEEVEVTVGAEGGPGSPVTVPPRSSYTLGEGESVQLGSVPAGPGDVMQLQVSTPSTGQNVLTVPVLGATDYYEDSGPASPSPSGSASASPSESPSATPSPSASPSS